MGHQPPAYLIDIEGEPAVDGDDERWVTGRTKEIADDKAKSRFPGRPLTLTRDPDVLCWWPFATLGRLEKTPNFEKLYPTSMLETGWDICSSG